MMFRNFGPFIALLAFAALPLIGRAQNLDSAIQVHPNAIENSNRTIDMIQLDNQVASMVQKHLEAEAEKKKKAEEEAKSQADAGKSAAAPDLSMSAKWNHGFEISTKDKHFRVHVGGRYQFDSSWYSTDQSVQDNIANQYRDGVDFRRARFRIDGTMYENTEWATEIDFVNSLVTRNQPLSLTSPGFTESTTVALTDFWWTFKEVPIVGNIRLGQQKEPIGFEHLVSSRFLPFMERSYNQDSFYGGLFNGFNPGIQCFRNYGDKDGAIQFGIFKPASNVFGYNIGDGDYSITGRMTHLLWYADEGRSLIHLGISGRQASAVSERGLPTRVQTFRTRDAIRSGLAGDWPSPASISLYGDDMQSLNGEAVAVYGPWTVQSEYLLNGFQDARTNLNGPGSNVTYHGGYIQLLYFLTGESDNYDREKGAFDRVKPTHAFRWGKAACGPCPGWGAWQIGSRYNFLDLNDEGFNGGKLHNLTTGLNWFWNPNMKWQFNYFATYRDVSETISFPNGSGWIHGFGTRIACDF